MDHHFKIFYNKLIPYCISYLAKILKVAANASNVTHVAMKEFPSVKRLAVFKKILVFNFGYDHKCDNTKKTAAEE